MDVGIHLRRLGLGFLHLWPIAKGDSMTNPHIGKYADQLDMHDDLSVRQFPADIMEAARKETKLPHPRRVSAFIEGMLHAAEIARASGNGLIASNAIQREVTTIALRNERRAKRRQKRKQRMQDIKGYSALAIIASAMMFGFLAACSRADQIEEQGRIERQCALYRIEMNNAAMKNGEYPPCP